MVHSKININNKMELLIVAKEFLSEYYSFYFQSLMVLELTRLDNATFHVG